MTSMSCNQCIQLRYVGDMAQDKQNMAQDKQSRERAEVELRCTHSAPVHSGFFILQSNAKY